MSSFADEGDRDKPIGCLETAIWCNACFLPSGVRWPLEAGIEGREGTFRVGSIILCEDCGQTLDEDGFPD